jgi:hypothetical protein
MSDLYPLRLDCPMDWHASQCDHRFGEHKNRRCFAGGVQKGHCPFRWLNERQRIKPLSLD